MPVYSIADIFEEPQYQERETITTVEHPKLGPVRMPNVIPRMGATPGRVRHGPELGAHNHELFVGELGLTEAELDALRQEGVI